MELVAGVGLVERRGRGSRGHDAEEGGHDLRAVGQAHRDGVARADAGGGERASQPLGGRAQLAVGRALPARGLDQRERAVGRVDQVEQRLVARHGGDPVQAPAVAGQHVGADARCLRRREPAALDAGREHALERLAGDVRREPRDLGLAGLVGSVQHLRGRSEAERGLDQPVDRERAPRDADREVEVDVGEDRGHERRLVRPRPAGVDQQHGLLGVALEQVEEARRARVRDEAVGVAAAGVDVHRHAARRGHLERALQQPVAHGLGVPARLAEAVLAPARERPARIGRRSGA